MYKAILTLFMLGIISCKNESELKFNPNTGKDYSPKYGEAIIYYLYHSGWAIKTKTKFLIFDYTKSYIDNEKADILNGIIDPKQISDENVIVFVSHSHSDHFNTEILDWAKSIKKIKYVFGWRAMDDTSHIYFGDHRRTVTFDSMEIKNVYHDFDHIPESAFLLKVDGVTIVHAGDHGQYEWNIGDAF
jgi:L-ascorbate metabolism protein UlaG (beta-lactamase superfamily)